MLEEKTWIISDKKPYPKEMRNTTNKYNFPVHLSKAKLAFYLSLVFQSLLKQALVSTILLEHNLGLEQQIMTNHNFQDKCW